MTTKPTPREPTPKMVEAGMRSDENHRPDYAAIWRAMWNAAPVVDRWQPIASAPNEGTPIDALAARFPGIRISLSQLVMPGHAAWFFATELVWAGRIDQSVPESIKIDQVTVNPVDIKAFVQALFRHD